MANYLRKMFEEFKNDETINIDDEEISMGQYLNDYFFDENAFFDFIIKDNQLVQLIGKYKFNGCNGIFYILIEFYKEYIYLKYNKIINIHFYFSLDSQIGIIQNEIFMMNKDYQEFYPLLKDSAEKYLPDLIQYL